MCVPGCHAAVAKRLSRRQVLAGSGGLAAVAALAPVAPARAQASSFSRVLDLTHPLPPDFPTYDGGSNLELETLVTLKADGYNMSRWHLVEHTGTHLDAQLTPDDLRAFERAHGEVQDGACVAMLSGWASRASGPEFRNADGDGVMHFPGFHVEAADYLMSERNAVGIAVDTLSLDYGPSKDFATHYAWLPSNRWGLEGVANLDQLPARGATLIVGGPKIVGATGGPSRVFALV